jgi:hypothetical protein
MVTEGPNHSDVFSINRNDFSYEYEIKLTKSDLDSELKCFDCSVNDWKRADNKQQKHHYYQMGLPLVEEIDKDWYGGFLSFKYRVPNKFCFVIPESLRSYLAVKLINSPYGIVTFPEERDYWRIDIFKKPDFLHKDKVDPALIAEMLDRSTNELVELRERLFLN